MSVVGDVFGVGGLSSLAQTIINKFVQDPDAKAKALEAVRQDSIQIQQMQDDLEIKLNDIAGQNIRADAQSEDKFTERARPLFMYIIEAIIFWNYVGLSIVKIWVPNVGPAVLPPDLLTLFGVCVTGYVFARSADKALALPGATNVSVLGGAIKGSNDGTAAVAEKK